MDFAHVKGGRKRFLPLLLLGDEQEDMINRYLARGEMYALCEAGEALAVCVVTDEGNGVLEIKNLAVTPRRQRQGLGRQMIREMERRYAGRFRVLRVGTGDSPLTVPFYEACGFVRAGVIPDFFTAHYDHPIVEAGVLLRDMVILEKTIGGDEAHAEGHSH